MPSPKAEFTLAALGTTTPVYARAHVTKRSRTTSNVKAHTVIWRQSSNMEVPRSIYRSWQVIWRRFSNMEALPGNMEA